MNCSTFQFIHSIDQQSNISHGLLGDRVSVVSCGTPPLCHRTSSLSPCVTFTGRGGSHSPIHTFGAVCHSAWVIIRSYVYNASTVNCLGSIKIPSLATGSPGLPNYCGISLAPGDPPNNVAEVPHRSMPFCGSPPVTRFPCAIVKRVCIIRCSMLLWRGSRTMRNLERF